MRTSGMADMDDLAHENEELKKRLKVLTAEAANNETILKRTQARELTLLGADSLAQLLRAMAVRWTDFARILFARRGQRRVARSSA